jgi:predicted nuclease with TOPRIM domain
MKYLSDKYDIELIKKQSKFESDYPLVMKRINKLEKNSHPCKEFHEFEVYPELMQRLEEIEKKLKIKK